MIIFKTTSKQSSDLNLESKKSTRNITRTRWMINTPKIMNKDTTRSYLTKKT